MCKCKDGYRGDGYYCEGIISVISQIFTQNPYSKIIMIFL